MPILALQKNERFRLAFHLPMICGLVVNGQNDDGTGMADHVAASLNAARFLDLVSCDVKCWAVVCDAGRDDTYFG